MAAINELFRKRIIAQAVIAAAVTVLIPPAETLASPGLLEEVVVTARKREESIQDVPIAITALSAEELRVKGVTRPDDLKFHTPGLEIRTQSVQRASISYFIRGQGQTFGSAPSVVTYFADAPFGNGQRVSIGNNSHLFDLASVQVLKGPQGTLFGRSTTGGAILFSPQRPGDQFGGFVQATAGSYDWFETTAAVDIPIVENVLNARLAANIVRRDGFTKALNTGQDLDDRNRDSFRFGLEFTPNERINSYFMYARTDVDENNSSAVLYDFNQSSPLYNTTPGAGQAWFAIQGLCGAITGGNASAAQACANQRLARLDQLREGLLAEEARVRNGGDSAKRYNVAGGELVLEGGIDQLLNITSFDIGKVGFLGDITFKNVFSTIRNRGVASKYDAGSPLPNALVYNNFDMANFQPIASGAADGSNDWLDDYSEEFQILGTIDNRHSWIVGIYHEEQKYDLTYPPLFSAYADVFSPTGSPQVVAAFGADQTEKQKGYFAQTTVDLSQWLAQRLSLTLGYRWSESTRSGGNLPADQAQLAQGNLAPGTTYMPRPDMEDSAPSWTVSLDYQLNNDTLLYLAHRRGFKPGGQNVSPSQPVAGFTATYDPETVDDVELGMKADWTIGGRPLRTNAAVYKMWYEDIQRSETFATTGGVPFTQVNNIAKAEIQGLELSGQVQLTDRLLVGLTYSYIDAAYTEWPGLVTNIITGAQLELEDSPYVGTPEHQGTLTLRYTLPTPGEWGEMTFSADYYRQSSVWLNDTALQDGFGKEEGYGNLNVRLDWANIFGKPVDLAVFAKNATDETYAVTMAGFYNVVGTAFQVYNEPRMVGAELRYRFGAQ